VFLIVSKKAYTSYLSLALLPICVGVALMRWSRGRQALFMLGCGIALLEPTLWFRVMKGGTLAGFLTGEARLAAVGFLLVEVALLASYTAMFAAIAMACAQHWNAGGVGPVGPD